MTSHQNTCEYYSSFMEFLTNSENCTYQNVYSTDDESPTNYNCPQITYAPENYLQQEVCPTLNLVSNIYDQMQSQLIYHMPYHENASDSKYNENKYTPLTPEEPMSYPVFHFQPMQLHETKQFMPKKHRANITILPSSKGNFKAVVKRKRKRTVFTTEQVAALEDIFKTTQYISRQEREEIVKKLQLNDKAVKIWFQNRRLKIKRTSEQYSDESEDYSSIRHLVDEKISPDMARLDFVESQINKKADEFGFVTLDEGVMRDLVTIIDGFLSKSSIDVTAAEISGSSGSPIYEPISPASISNSNEDNSSCWSPSEPDEALQRLFDLQSMISL